MARVNAEVDINIVAATGLYTYDDIPQFFHIRGPGTPMGGPEPMVEMFLRDIREGIGGTDIKAAFLNWNYQHIGTDVLPALRAAGVTDEQIITMLVDNPRRYFTP